MSLTAKKAETKNEVFILKGLNCAVCATKIIKKIDELPEVIQVDYNKITGMLNIRTSISEYNIESRVQEIISGIEPGVNVIRKQIANNESKYADKTEQRGHSHTGHTHQNLTGNYKWRLGIGSVLFITALIVYFLPAFTTSVADWLKLSLFTLSYFLIGGPVIISFIRNIFRGQIFDEEFLMTVATIGAFAIGEYPEGVAVMLFYTIGEMFQDRAIASSRRSIKELMDIKADYANLKTVEKIKRVAPEEVSVGNFIIIKPGEKVPIDGKVIKGETMVDTTALTGESLPRKIKAGDTVLSGMINKNGLITVRTTKIYEESTVARILDLVENAGSKKSKTEEFITKFARYYTPTVVFTAVAVAIIPPLVIPGAIFSKWFYRALIFLVISCPCALVISIPLSYFAGIGKASRQGILIKGGNYLEALRKVEKVVFDKTGTLTCGVFEVTKVKAIKGFTEDEVLSMAAIAEYHSNHPIAASIVKANKDCINSELIESYEEISGYGIKAKTSDGEILVGNYQLLKNEGIKVKPANESGTIVYIAINNKLAGYIVITDRVKEDAFIAIKSLKDIGIKQLFMLTGDRKTVADSVAGKLKITKYYAELLPVEKVNKLEELIAAKSKKGKLVFVGDGINDAPVLARSDIGIAMGGLGSDAAIEAADIVLMTDEPSKLTQAIKIAKRTGTIIWQNIIIILGIKSAVLIMGILGVATMWEAIFADVGVALLAVLNSMRILTSHNS